MIPKLSAEYLIKQVDTDGHCPLFVQANDGSNYFAKYLNSLRTDELCLLVYEMVAVEILKKLKLPHAEQAIIEIPPNIIDKKISYSKSWKRNVTAWGSKEIAEASLVSEINNYSTKTLFNQIENPEDLIHIAIFDLWVENTDRKQENYNLIAYQKYGKIRFVPIDHGAIFGGFDRIGIFSGTLPCSANNKLISSDLFKQIVSRIPQNKQLQISKDFINLLSQVNLKEVLNDVFHNIPESWKINKTLKDRIEKFLLSDLRMQSLINTVNSRLPLKPKK
ncbi:CotH kinase family protein [Chryseobacterium suipulveris]|uniref:CotH kinase family protein n=1 Tax=Chryseobacterium suipulveris TaxID=2929800 RepID=A0ABY4BU25_9FLAO|nr:CotH kinase family protein [Chryseobacterium suipulveris]UOE41188.1 CotH kinase family protein [Chryseobacterium suipulveris]